MSEAAKSKDSTGSILGIVVQVVVMLFWQHND